MTDIIANAQRLLNGATPAPWEMSETEVTHRLLGGEVYQYGGEPVLVVGGDANDVSPSAWGDEPPYCYEIHRAADGELMAAAPAHAQALAEETYEYSYQIKYADGWETACTDVTHVDKWWPDRSEAEEAANSAYDPYINRPMRLVCRRVSPPEVLPNTTINPAAAGATESDK